MKKVLTLIAAATFAMGVSAQHLHNSKITDNWYVGVHGGVSTQTTHNSSWANDLNPNAGIRVGRWITPVIGVAVDADAYFSNKLNVNLDSRGLQFNHHNYVVGGVNNTYGIVAATNATAMFTVNALNLFWGYKGTPRFFEVNPVAGLGWGHYWVARANGESKKFGDELNVLSSKAGFDLALNFGSVKQFQAYVEPAMLWVLASQGEQVQMNINKSQFQVNAGLIYKFKNSNGTHNFKAVEIKDQAEIDALNGKINALRKDVDKANADNNNLKKQNDDLKKKLAECEAAPKQVEVRTKSSANLESVVTYGQGKITIDKSQLPNVERIATYMKKYPNTTVKIMGFASPEGNPEVNNRIAQARADAVKNLLVAKYKIAATRITCIGNGVGDMFSEPDWNRVAISTIQQQSNSTSTTNK